VELEYLENLIDFAIPTEERFLFSQLCEDAANCPDINSQTVLLLSEQNFGGSVPEGLDLMREGFDGKTEGSGESEVSDFEGSLSVDEKILRFEVSVNDSAGVAVVDAVAELIKEEFDLVGGHGVFVLAQVFLHVVLD
jgi:hypothetical protein